MKDESILKKMHAAIGGTVRIELGERGYRLIINDKDVGLLTMRQAGLMMPELDAAEKREKA